MRKRIYWLIHTSEVRYENQLEFLRKQLFQPVIVGSMTELEERSEEKRAAIIFISDADEDSKILAILQDLMRNPLFRVTQNFLILEKFSPKVMQHAAGMNFRDMLPIHLSNSLWLSRIQFATNPKRDSYTRPSLQLSVNELAAVHVPAYITRASESHVRIESRITPEIGSQLTLEGELVKKLGVDFVNCKVQAIDLQRINYRYCNALTCSWDLRRVGEQSLRKTFMEIESLGTSRRYRVLMAIKSRRLRYSLLNHLNRRVFDINTVLKADGLYNDLPFFTPHVVLVESSLIRGRLEEAFREMMKILADKVIVFLLGPIDTRIEKSVNQLYPTKNIRFIEKDYDRLPNLISKAFRNSKEQEDMVSLIPYQSIALANIRISARVTRIHPYHAQIATNFPLKPFTLSYVSSPIISRMLGKGSWLKVTSVSLSEELKDQQHLNYLHDGILIDSSAMDKQRAAAIASDLVASHFLSDKMDSDPLKPREPGIAPRIVRDEEEPEKKSPRKKTKPSYQREPAAQISLKTFFLYVAGSVIAIGFLWALFTLMAKDWERSGRIYSEEIKKLSPRFRTQPTTQPENER